MRQDHSPTYDHAAELRARATIGLIIVAMIFAGLTAQHGTDIAMRFLLTVATVTVTVWFAGRRPETTTDGTPAND